LTPRDPCAVEDAKGPSERLGGEKGGGLEEAKARSAEGLSEKRPIRIPPAALGPEGRADVRRGWKEAGLAESKEAGGEEECLSRGRFASRQTRENSVITDVVILTCR
jgi:hypothetical protein